MYLVIYSQIHWNFIEVRDWYSLNKFVFQDSTPRWRSPLLTLELWFNTFLSSLHCVIYSLISMKLPTEVRYSDMRLCFRVQPLMWTIANLPHIQMVVWSMIGWIISIRLVGDYGRSSNGYLFCIQMWNAGVNAVIFYATQQETEFVNLI